jgi:hypothetical protein
MSGARRGDPASGCRRGGAGGGHRGEVATLPYAVNKANFAISL